jgi:hypothetical protein
MSIETRHFEGIEARVPVLDAESEQVFDSERLDKQWGLVTEAIRQQVLHNPETRKLCAGYVSTPVSEELAEEFVTAMASVDPRVAQLAARYKATLREYLSLPPVPDEQVKPDIRNAPI